jgi:hypothetical protein
MWCSILAGLLASANPAVLLRAGGRPINVDMGHAAPFVADLKGDGDMVLLVGQFGQGKLRLYPNVGSRRSANRHGWQRCRHYV